MVRGLALAETTPGPLIMVVQFVAFVGAYRSPRRPQPLPPRCREGSSSRLSLDPWIGLCDAVATRS